MNALVDRFNQTVGRQKGIIVSVTSISNSTDIHFALTRAAKKQPGAGHLPDLFVSYPKTALVIGAENLMDWKDWLSEDQVDEYVPAFVAEGLIEGRLALLPVAKSSSALFVNAAIFEEFAGESGVGYEDLATWEGMFRVAELYHRWSGGRAFFKYDDWLHYSLVNTASLGGEMFQDGRVNFRDKRFQEVWRRLAASALKGEVSLLGGYSTTAMMTGEAVCGVESTASVLYFKDTVTWPDNTATPLDLKIMPVPRFENGRPLAIQRGGGLGVIKSTKQKEHAAAIFGQWLTAEENNLPFVTATGYFPVKTSAYQKLLKGEMSFPDARYAELYRTVGDIQARYSFFVPPFFNGYGELEKAFCAAQQEIFAKYRDSAAQAGASPPDVTREMFLELEKELE